MDGSSQIDLFRGWASDSLLPRSLLLDASRSLLTKPDLSYQSLIYGSNPGLEPLVDHIASWLSRFYQTPQTSPSRLTISGGASASIGNILQTFTDPTYTQAVFMVAPTYFLASRIFEDHGFAGRLRAVPEDSEGIDLPFLEDRLQEYQHEDGNRAKATKEPTPSQIHYKFVLYCVPTFSNPSGKVMSRRRREQLVRLARKYDILLITDDVYDQLCWYSSTSSGHALMPRLVDIDHNLDGGPLLPFGNTVSNGSFSKILGPGLRTGWTESTELFAAGLAECGSTGSAGGASSQMVSGIISEAFENGSVQKYLDEVLKPTYESRSTAALAAADKYLTPYGATVENSLFADRKGLRIVGGYYLYIRLPKGLLAKRVAELASEVGVTFGPGEVFQVHGDEASVPIRDTLRICFASEDEFALVEGIRRLGVILSDLVEGWTDETVGNSSDDHSD